MNEIFCTWFAWATWYLPTPNYWQLEREAAWKASALPNIPGV